MQNELTVYSVNVDNIMRLARILDAMEDPNTKGLVIGFNMAEDISNGRHRDRSVHECGTTACIGGHAALLALLGENPGLDIMSIVRIYKKEHEAERMARTRKPVALERGALWLGDVSLIHATGNNRSLFFGHPSGVGFENVTPKMAANVLRRLARTGTVDWDEANPDIDPSVNPYAEAID